MIIGITGGTGCGKTTLLEVIGQLGGKVLDCDAIYHRLLQTDDGMLAALQKRFPTAFSEGKLDRKALGKLVFADAAALRELNKITHAAVRAYVERALEREQGLVGIDAIGLFESGLASLCDVTVAVTAPEESRLQRLMAREGISEEYALSRIRAQKSNEQFAALCDHTLVNDGSKEQFREKCLAFLRQRGIMKP